jgi:hypothetical protein
VPKKSGFDAVADKLALAEELAAKVRGYFTNPKTGKVDIFTNLTGDRDLYELATRITNKTIQPGPTKVDDAKHRSKA